MTPTPTPMLQHRIVQLNISSNAEVEEPWVIVTGGDMGDGGSAI